jgi:hypothetical protein
MSPEAEVELKHSVAIANLTMAIMEVQNVCDDLAVAKAVSTMSTVLVAGDDQETKTALAVYLIGLARELDTHALEVTRLQ